MQEANKQFKAIKNCCNKNIELYRLRGTILKGIFLLLLSFVFFSIGKPFPQRIKKDGKRFVESQTAAIHI